jgi:4-amino-4-deoxy-L-arabinose transferase-like glycosyltransferase
LVKVPSKIAAGTALAFVISLAVSGWDVSRDGIAATYSDPIAHRRSQDEAVIVNSAIRMTQDGDWLTPKVMGRLFLFKPPLLMWLAAASIRHFGLSLWAVRLPSLLLGAAGIAAVFAWCARARSPACGVLAGGIMLCSPFWQIFSRLCLTDVLASSLGALALVGVAFDPQLSRVRTRVLFGFFGAASILAKSVAGVVPFAALILYFAILTRERRPSLASLGWVLLAAAAVLAPWHIYQAVVHPQWFWADYVQVQLLGVGLRPEGSGLLDLPILYYLRRLVEMDPIVVVFALVGLAGAIRVVRSRQASAALLAICWTAVTLAVLCAFQGQNLAYMVFLVPPLCIVGALCGPALWDRRAVFSVVFVAVLVLVKTAAGGQAWSLRPESPPMDGAQAMRAYYGLHRDAELIVVEGNDEFYSATLPLPHVRYCFLDLRGWTQRFAPHYVYLGITLTAEQFAALPNGLAEFEERLRSWGVKATEGIGAAVTMREAGEVAMIFRARPESDFYLPAAWVALIPEAEKTHQVLRYSAERVFLLSRASRGRKQPVPEIPGRW